VVPTGLARTTRGFRAAVTTVAVCGLAAAAQAQELTGKVFVEGRLFPTASIAGLARGNVSIAVEPEWYAEWDDGRQTLTVVPFARLDQHDDARTHADIRELTWTVIGDTWELRTGVRKVFWGVTESNHLVDIINQTDLVEDLDGEEKLGQPMVNLALIRDWGTLDAYALLGFRERRFFGSDGRPGIPFPLDTSRARFESTRGKTRLDWAVRWSHAIGPLDIGLSQFHGTSRDPRFLPDVPGGDAAGEALLSGLLTGSEGSIPDGVTLLPIYDIIEQTGLDLQITSGGWLWKLEAINRAGQGVRYAALTGGFEYTFGNMRASGIDLGVLTEYSFDERDAWALTPLEDDVFVGARFALNDVQRTEILGGAAIDRESGASFTNVEASRRVGDNSTLDLEFRGFVRVPVDDLFLYGIREDDYLQARWTWHW
jgi:hypothetical protein